MAYIPGVVTDVGRDIWPKMLFGIKAFRAVSLFRIGEGGWIDPGTGAVPRVPDATLTDVDCIVNPSRYPVSSRYTYDKALTLADFTFVAPSTVQVRCLLDYGEGNDTGTAYYWELGVFCEDPDTPGSYLLLGYCTFAQEMKDATRQIENLVRFVF